MQRILLTGICAVMTIFGGLTRAQQPEDRIHVRIDAHVHGEKLKVDTFINSLAELDLEAYMRELGLEEELNQLNIDIHSGFNMGQYWDSAAMNDMMESLRNIDIPQIPHIPQVPMVPRIPEIDWSAVSPDHMAYKMGNKAVLGVFTDKVPEGALINGLTENGAAKAAGLLEGDIITSIDQRTIESPANLSEVIGMYNPGDQVTVTYLRDGQTKKMDIVLQENTDMFSTMFEDFNLQFSDSFFTKEPFLFEMHAPERGFLGVYLEDGAQKVIVTGVEENSAALDAGLQAGDVILELNDTKVASYDDVIRFMENTKPGDKVKITYERDGKRKNSYAILQPNNGGTYFFKFNDDEEGYIKQNIDIRPMITCPPGSAYSYSSGDGTKQINICITAIQDKDGAENVQGQTEQGHALLDPSNLTVYSNPSDGTFNVRFSITEPGDTYISITDMTGKEVFAETLSNFSGTFDRSITLESVSKGNYFVKVRQNGYSTTKTVVVQ